MRTSETEGWEHIGRAAEHFARRVAKDARRFAERIEAHVGDFAHDLRRGWRGGYGGDPADVRRIFEDVRGVLAAVLDGVDELIGGVLHEERDEGWARVVCNREATCAGCARPIAAGAEAYVRRGAGGKEFRCLECGAPREGTPA